MFLLDTNVVSAPAQAVPDRSVLGWIGRQKPSDIYISAITIAEVEQGIAAIPHSRRRLHLEAWRDEMVDSMEGRIIPVELEIARAWGSLRARLAGLGRSIEPLDAFIAATAEVNNLVLVTRNVKHFNAWGGPLLNPWTEG